MFPGGHRHALHEKLRWLALFPARFAGYRPARAFDVALARYIYVARVVNDRTQRDGEKEEA